MPAASLRALCPAKINLSLRVLGAREDGYHELDTVFQTVDLYDELLILPAAELSLACDDPALPVDDSNLVLRAAHMLLERTASPPRGASLVLRKRIPTQGGLGGGSSDAAGALRLCSRFWGLTVEPSALEDMAAALGADVPFFLVGGTARGRGRGDRIERLPPFEASALLLGSPPFGVSTREAFARLGEGARLRGEGPRSDGARPGLAPFEAWVNDLEPAVFAGWPELEVFRDALLSSGAQVALLSGSGSTVFGLFSEGPAVQRAIERLRQSFPRWKLRTARTVQAPSDLAASS